LRKLVEGRGENKSTEELQGGAGWKVKVKERNFNIYILEKKKTRGRV